MKNFKKLIAVILCVAMIVPTVCVAGFAGTENADVTTTSLDSAMESVFAEGENSLIVFVTGIGQSWSYLFDESYTEEGAFENGTLQDYENYAELIANDKAIARWNLFNNYFDEAIKDPEFLKSAVSAVFSLLFGMFTRTNLVKDEDVETIVSKLFSFNIIDENGKTSDRVVTPRYVMPVSEYPYGTDSDGYYHSEAKDRFYRSIPCEEICKSKLGENFEDYLYCYNYSAFSYTSNNVSGLHEFIETITADNKVGAKDVILVPMSMGASVVSAYLAAYPDVSDNHVRRVVSIVGCWNGSDVVYDLLTQSYVDNSADLFYDGIIADMIGDPWGNVVNFALRLFSKKALRNFIDQVLSVISDKILLSTPSLLALVPDYYYDEIRDMIPEGNVLNEADTYHAAQSTLKTRLAALEDQGITFSFICGYGLPYGAITSDYTAFGFMAHSATTNSDEIININSTAPGTSYVAYNSQFEDTDGRELSPDGTIDISTCYYKDSTWYFYGQKHELEYNNTAIRLAIDLALGNIETVEDCDNLEEDGVYYPQFNEARYIRSLEEDYIPAIEAYLKSGKQLTAEQQALYEKALAMRDSTVNNAEEDEKIINDVYQMLVDLGVYTVEEDNTSDFEKFLSTFLEKNNDRIVKMYGSKGFLDFDPVC